MTDTRFAILTDLHANLAAVRAVLDDIDRQGVTSLLCMGDFVGYNASPAEVIRAFHDRPLTAIRGNHDRYALGENTDLIRPATAEAIAFTRKALGPDDLAFLQPLDDSRLVDNRILLVHGSLRDRDEYIIPTEVAIANHRLLRTDYAGVYLAFFGHTHIPLIVGEGRVIRDIPKGHVLELQRMTPYLINPGAVGQPRDGNPDAAYAILDLAARTVTFHRVAYDVADTQRRILEAGLQRHLADRLAAGR
jgi:predicted phosphodiesterase